MPASWRTARNARPRNSGLRDTGRSRVSTSTSTLAADRVWTRRSTDMPWYPIVNTGRTTFQSVAVRPQPITTASRLATRRCRLLQRVPTDDACYRPGPHLRWSYKHTSFAHVLAGRLDSVVLADLNDQARHELPQSHRFLVTRSIQDLTFAVTADHLDGGAGDIFAWWLSG
jgi:hypothetical protein